MTAHMFDTRIAKDYGIEEAIIIQNMFFWINKNYANNNHIHDGSVWTYNSASAFAEIFEYMNVSKIHRVIDNLCKKDIIKKGNYNKIKLDRTCWYAFTESGISILQNYGFHFAKMKNANYENEEPIPYVNNTDNNTDNNTNNNNINIKPNQDLSVSVSEENNIMPKSINNPDDDSTELSRLNELYLGVLKNIPGDLKSKTDYCVGENIHDKLFEQFRYMFPGNKRGFKTEFMAFKKKHKNWMEVIDKLSLAVIAEHAVKSRLKAKGDFCPQWKNMSTWINNSCWEQEFGEIDVNVAIKQKTNTDASGRFFDEQTLGHNVYMIDDRKYVIGSDGVSYSIPRSAIRRPNKTSMFDVNKMRWED